jgi:hypothetical protein
MLECICEDCFLAPLVAAESIRSISLLVMWLSRGVGMFSYYSRAAGLNPMMFDSHQHQVKCTLSDIWASIVAAAGHLTLRPPVEHNKNIVNVGGIRAFVAEAQR